MYLKILISLLTLCSFNEINAQEYNNWYFGGRASVSFTPTGQAIPYATGGSVMIANEGCASISSEDGDLLFYTNGRTIYNKNHQVMFNGDNLLGHESAYQSAVILQLPNQDSLYYIFTSDALENNFSNGYRYSIVNMKKNNGLGAVVVKNTLLQARGSERLTAAKHANGVDRWIITNDDNSNVFRAYLFTCNGLAAVPVVSIVGEILDDYESMNIGTLRVSPNGRKICQTAFPNADVISQNNFFQLFDFDNATGQLSNPLKIILNDVNVHCGEFSGNSELLYLTNPFKNKVIQLEVTPVTAASIVASRFDIDAALGFYGIQLGPDGKIYLNQSDVYISVIRFPDIKGNGCSFQLDKISLNGKSGRLAFPFLLNKYDEFNNFTYQVTDSCLGHVQFNAFTNMPGNVQWFWEFGDGSTSVQQNPSHIFTDPNRIYLVKLKIRSDAICGYILQSHYIMPKGKIVNANFDFVVKCDSNSVRFFNTSDYTDTVSFSWSFGDGGFSDNANPVHSYNASGLYNITLIASGYGQCATDSITKILNLIQLNIQTPSEQTIHEGQSVQLYVTGGATWFEWYPSTWLSNTTTGNPVATPLQSITYHVNAKNDVGCQDSDSVRINVIPITEVFIPTAFTPDRDGLNDIFKPILGQRFVLHEFSVYSRWGQRVFHTTQKHAGWNGTYAGTMQNSGMYLWTIRYTDHSGKLTKRSGSVLLIR